MSRTSRLARLSMPVIVVLVVAGIPCADAGPRGRDAETAASAAAYRPDDDVVPGAGTTQMPPPPREPQAAGRAEAGIPVVAGPPPSPATVPEASVRRPAVAATGQGASGISPSRPDAVDPSAPLRRRLAPWVLLFLLSFTGLAWLLQREYWKDAGGE